MTEQFPPPTESNLNFDEALAKEITRTTTVNWNIVQKVIIITEDKLWRIIIKHYENVDCKKGWVAPAGIFITLVIALVATASFQEIFGLKPSEWKALFILLTIGSGIWLLIKLLNIKRNITIDVLVKEIKSSSESVNYTPIPSNELQTPVCPKEDGK